MALHKYSVGDRVIVQPSRTTPNVRPGTYEITQAMPDTGMGMGCQYRAKSTLDTYQRVFDEAQLRKA